MKALNKNKQDFAPQYKQDNVVPIRSNQSIEQKLGMPEMDRSGPVVSRYEFWPTWFFLRPPSSGTKPMAQH